ncbi:MAG: hypothetical protein ACYTX0_32005 [Nostoc sp.]
MGDTRPLAKGGQDFGVSATSLRDAPPTTTLLRRRSVQVSTSQSNAAHRTRLDNLFVRNPLR